jgi:AAA domain
MPGLERQALRAAGALTGTGLRFVPVEHQGNQSESPEEVDAIARLHSGLLRGGATWTDEHGSAHQLTAQDILVVAPYNAQVAALRTRLGTAARVGTVDKFQGQEAPVVICSITTSTTQETPRGMEFLYSPHRLNVATSRARCLAVLVASADLLIPRCRTPRQIQLANAPPSVPASLAIAYARKEAVD